MPAEGGREALLALAEDLERRVRGLQQELRSKTSKIERLGRDRQAMRDKLVRTEMKLLLVAEAHSQLKTQLQQAAVREAKLLRKTQRETASGHLALVEAVEQGNTIQSKWEEASRAAQRALASAERQRNVSRKLQAKLARQKHYIDDATREMQAAKERECATDARCMRLSKKVLELKEECRKSAEQEYENESKFQALDAQLQEAREETKRAESRTAELLDMRSARDASTQTDTPRGPAIQTIVDPSACAFDDENAIDYIDTASVDVVARDVKVDMVSRDETVDDLIRVERVEAPTGVVEAKLSDSKGFELSRAISDRVRQRQDAIQQLAHSRQIEPGRCGPMTELGGSSGGGLEPEEEAGWPPWIPNSHILDT